MLCLLKYRTQTKVQETTLLYTRNHIIICYYMLYIILLYTRNHIIICLLKYQIGKIFKKATL